MTTPTQQIAHTYDATLADIRQALRRLLAIPWDGPDSARREEAITALEQARDALEGYQEEDAQAAQLRSWGVAPR